MQTKFSSELTEIEKSERCYRDKYADIRSKLSESEASRENAQASAKQFELQLQYTKRVIINPILIIYLIIYNNHSEYLLIAI